MSVDRQALEDMNSGKLTQPQLRFFQWDKPTTSYGYLINLESRISNFEAVRRPTGGGVVHHQTTDLSLSILWPRHQNIFPENPRECYRVIHEKLLKALLSLRAERSNLSLQQPCHSERSEESRSFDRLRRSQDDKVPLCYEQPVCNDVMKDGKKIIGGALRLTRNAILYQGNILLVSNDRLDELKKTISDGFSSPFPS